MLIAIKFHILILFTGILSATAVSAQDTVFIYGEKQYPPFEFINEAGAPDGYNIELSTALLERLNIPYVVKLMDWDQVLEEYASHPENSLMSMIYTGKRAVKYDFGPIHSHINHKTAYRDDIAPPVGFNELEHLSVVLAKDRMEDEYFVFLEQSLWTRTSSADSCLIHISQGLADATILPESVINNVIKRNNLQGIKLIDIPISPREYCFVSGNAKLRSQLELGLDAMNSDGSYDVIYNKWLKKDSTKHIPIIISEILGAILIILLLVGVYLWWYRLVIAKTLKNSRLEYEHFRLLLENTVVGLEYYDSEGFFIEANQADRDILGTIKGDPRLKSINLFDNPLTKSYFSREKIEPYSDIITCDFRPDIKDPYFDVCGRNELFYLKIQIMPIKDDNGKLVSIICTTIDVTEENIHNVEILKFCRRRL